MFVVTMRRLIHIPIIHTSADLGSLSKFVQAHYARVCGKTSWNQREDVVKALWTDIQANLDALHLDARKTRIYQDGLPICGFEEKIVRELAKAGSSNHQLILGLLDQGAVLMGTEDSQLLMEEYELQKQYLAQEAGKNVNTRGTAKAHGSRAQGTRFVHRGADCQHASRGRGGAAVLGRSASAGCAYGPPIFAWKRSERAYTKLYGGHGPRTTHRPS